MTAAAPPLSTDPHPDPDPTPTLSPLTRPQVVRVLREVLPRRRWTHADLRRWLATTQRRNARATASHAKRRQLMLHELSLSY